MKMNLLCSDSLTIKMVKKRNIYTTEENIEIKEEFQAQKERTRSRSLRHLTTGTTLKIKVPPTLRHAKGEEVQSL